MLSYRGFRHPVGLTSPPVAANLMSRDAHNVKPTLDHGAQHDGMMQMKTNDNKEIVAEFVRRCQDRRAPYQPGEFLPQGEQALWIG